MKLLVVLFAVVAAASAYPGHIPWAAPVVSHPAPAWQPAPWPAPVWPAPAPPKYVKLAPVVAAPVVAKVHHAPAVHQVLHVPQPSIPNPHPQPLTIKVSHGHAVDLPLHSAKVGHPHLVGFEAHVPEPDIKVVAAHHGHHSW